MSGALHVHGSRPTSIGRPSSPESRAVVLRQNHDTTGRADMARARSSSGDPLYEPPSTAPGSTRDPRRGRSRKRLEVGKRGFHRGRWFQFVLRPAVLPASSPFGRHTMPSAPRQGSWSSALCYVGSALLVSTGLVVVTGQPLGAREPLKPGGCGAMPNSCHLSGTPQGYDNTKVGGICCIGCGTCASYSCNGKCVCEVTAGDAHVACEAAPTNG
jgi:hypothetical protein